MPYGHDESDMKFLNRVYQMSTKKCPQTVGAQGFADWEFLDVYHASTNVTFLRQTARISVKSGLFLSVFRTARGVELVWQGMFVIICQNMETNRPNNKLRSHSIDDSGKN